MFNIFPCSNDKPTGDPVVVSLLYHCQWCIFWNEDLADNLKDDRIESSRASIMILPQWYLEHKIFEKQLQRYNYALKTVQKVAEEENM